MTRMISTFEILKHQEKKERVPRTVIYECADNTFFGSFFNAPVFQSLTFKFKNIYFVPQEQAPFLCSWDFTIVYKIASMIDLVSKQWPHLHGFARFRILFLYTVLNSRIQQNICNVSALSCTGIITQLSDFRNNSSVRIHN